MPANPKARMIAHKQENSTVPLNRGKLASFSLPRLQSNKSLLLLTEQQPAPCLL